MRLLSPLPDARPLARLYARVDDRRSPWVGRSAALCVVCVSLLTACATPPPPPPEMPAERVAAPGEAPLALGITAYRAGRWAEAEAHFKQALILGLSIGPDRATAHKHLAFIYCTSKREALCASAFRAAREADPAFVLSRTEAGHPMWGPVYRKALP